MVKMADTEVLGRSLEQSQSEMQLKDLGTGNKQLFETGDGAFTERKIDNVPLNLENLDLSQDKGILQETENIQKLSNFDDLRDLEEDEDFARELLNKKDEHQNSPKERSFD